MNSSNRYKLSTAIPKIGDLVLIHSSFTFEVCKVLESESDNQIITVVTTSGARSYTPACYKLLVADAKIRA